MKELSVFEYSGTLVVDSRLIAERLGIDHSDWISNIIIPYQSQAESLGVVRFENAKPKKGSKGGRPQRYALLSEDPSNFYMTLSRNSPEVVECKLQLVKAFSKAKEHLKHHSMRGAFWYERIRIALSDASLPLGQGYFCAYLEMMKFFQELEVHANYIVPDTDPETDKYIVPDISIGIRFNTWLRSEDEKARTARAEILGDEQPVDFRPERFNKDKETGEQVLMPEGSHRHEITSYNHVYPKSSHGHNNVKSVNSYPNRYLEIFKYFLGEVWIPQHCHNYISQRDPDGWAIAMNNLLQMPATARVGLSRTLVGALLPSLPEAA